MKKVKKVKKILTILGNIVSTENKTINLLVDITATQVD